ncbi:incFII family plasmid replication initiator RepA, partial [Salmonella enterica subsp. enterica serovar Dublin]
MCIRDSIRARARRDADRTRKDIETLVKLQLTREYASGRFTGGLDAMKRELQRRVKERMMMSRGKNYTRLTMATVPI